MYCTHCMLAGTFLLTMILAMTTVIWRMSPLKRILTSNTTTSPMMSMWAAQVTSMKRVALRLCHLRTAFLLLTCQCWRMSPFHLCSR